jgi:ankyrin repeat protein
MTPLMVAAQVGHFDVIECLVAELGVEVNKACNDGRSALWMAAAEGNLDAVRCILKLRVNVNQASNM